MVEKGNVTPVAEPEKTGRELLVGAKPVIDYSEEEIDPAVAPVEPAPVTPPAPVVDQREQQLRDAQTRLQILQVEAERAKAERDLLLMQRNAPPQVQPVQEPQVDLNALFQENPLQAMEYIAQKAADEKARQVIQQQTVSSQQQEQIQAYEQAKKEFAANVDKVTTENKELSDPNHRLTQLYIGLEKEFPQLLTRPDGPLKALEIAKQRYELEQLKAGKAQTQAPKDEVSEEQPEEDSDKTTPAVRTTPRMATMVSGQKRGVPPSPSVKLSPEEELIARKMHLSAEQFKHYKSGNPKMYMKEEAPRRRSL